MKIALLDAFPQAPFTAEREFIARCAGVLERLGHEAIAVSTSNQIIEYDPDIVFSTHHLAPKLTEHFTVGTLWDPFQFYKDEADRLRSIRSWDLVVPIDESKRQFAVDLHFPARHRTSVSVHNLYPSAPVIDRSFAGPVKLSLAYVGAHWDGARHEAFFRRLADEVDLHVYGPPAAWEYIPTSYRGSIPFDGTALFETLNRHGAVLALHKESHRREDTPSMRPFEACAAKCLVITDAMPSLQALFGDSFSYVDMDAGVERAVQQVKLALETANRERGKTAARIDAANRIFNERVSLDAMLPPILAEAEAIISRKKTIAVRTANAPTVSVIIRCGGRPLDMISRAVTSIRRQLYPRVSLIFARFAPIEGFDDYVADLRGSNHFDDVSVYDVGGRGKRSESMWTGLRAVKTSFFAMLDDDDQWFPDHLHHLMEVFESDRSVDFVYSGGIRHDEEGHSPILHPRLWRNDGTCLDEKRALIFCDTFDIGRLLKWDNVILSHAFIARSELLAAEVLDDPRLDVMEDVYLYLILLARGAKFAFNGRATAVWNWRVRSNDNSMVNYEMARRAEQVERIIRRLGQYRFAGNYLGQDVIGRGIGSIAATTFEGSPIALESRSVDIVYDAALEDLISLRKPGWPSCLSSVKGISCLEDWGRWTEGEIIEFKFRHPLPRSFEFEFVARPASTMWGKTVTIAVGGFSKVITVKNKHLTTYRVPVRHDHWSDTIVMRIANPMSPAEVANDPNGDVRKLGLAMTSIRIIPKRRFMDSPLASVISPGENKRNGVFFSTCLELARGLRMRPSVKESKSAGFRNEAGTSAPLRTRQVPANK